MKLMQGSEVPLAEVVKGMLVFGSEALTDYFLWHIGPEKAADGHCC